MTARYAAGVDCSTQTTKVIVVDIDTGRAVALGKAANIVHRRGPASETDPQDWWTSLRQAVADTGRAGDIGALSIAAQQLGLVTLDAAHTPVRHAILWDDTRSGDAAVMLHDQLGGARHWAERVGTPPQAGFTIASWAWLRGAEPANAARTAHIRLPHDYLTERLCGAAITDRGDASGTGWWSSHTNAYVPDVLALEAVALTSEMLPEVLAPDQQAGTVRPSAAAEIGLPAGIPVGTGTGDNMGAALALGIDIGQPVISLGTSGTAYVRSQSPSQDAEGRIFSFASTSGDYLPLACTLNATLAVDHMATLLGIDREDVASGTDAVVLPYFNGERLPAYPNARGSILGLDGTVSAQELLLATYQGAAFSLLQSIELLDCFGSGIDPEAPVILVGGGAQGPVWQETVKRLTGRPLLLPDSEEHVAWGAAAQAAGLLTGEPAIEVARRWKISGGARHDPVPRDTALLDHLNAIKSAMHGVNDQKLFL